jgi:acyl-CoA thioesterase-2
VSEAIPLAAAEFDDLLHIEPVDRWSARGSCHEGSPDRVFGGHLVALAMVAACRTVASERAVHSVHAHFVSAARPHQPIDFQVAGLRDSAAFSTRTVAATQAGRPVLAMNLSFHLDEPSLEYQYVSSAAVAAPPDLPPEGGRSVSHPIGRALQVREVGGAPLAEPGRRTTWVRARRPPEREVDRQEAALAYIADSVLPMTAIAPLGGRQRAVYPTASLDLAMWFHRPVDVGQWLLFDGTCSTLTGSKGLGRVEVFSASGALVATAVQEALVRSAGLAGSGAK